MQVYLAAPFFNEKEIAVYEEVIKILREEKQNLNVFVPREHTIPNAWDLSNHIWGENVFAVDYLAITNCDIVVVLNFGMYSDSGTAWECGAAYALKKKVVNVLCGDSDTEYSIMMVNGTQTTITLEQLHDHPLSYLLNYPKEITNKTIFQK